MLYRRNLCAVTTLVTFAVASTSTAAPPLGGPSVVDACAALDLRDCSVQHLHLDGLGQGEMGLDLQFEGRDRFWTFWPHSNRGAAYQVLLQVEGGDFVEQAPGLLNTFRGSDSFDPQSIAALSIDDDGFRVQFRDSDGTVWFAEPLLGRARGAGPEHYAVYLGEDIISPDAVCGADETWRVFEHESGKQGDSFGPRGTTLLVADMAVDVDYKFYNIYGNSTDAVENRVNAVINAVNNQYESQTDVTHEIQTIVIRTSSSSDPYAGTNDIETLLYRLQDDWNGGNHSGIARDMVHLFTGANTGGTIGLAYLGGLCSNYEYGVVQSNCCGSFGCATDLSAHEMGHNWSSEHCTCPGWTMNPSLTCANQFSSQSINYITGFRDANQSCLDIGGAFGACCYATTCLERAEVECDSTGGAFQGDGTDCADVVCDLSTGACCTQSGSCNVLTEAQCEVIGGTYNGDGVPCEGASCTLGACCIVSSCSETTESGCAGLWLGPDSTCDGNPCTANGFAGLTHRVVGVNLVDTPGMDNWTIDIFAEMNPGERIDAVAGTQSQLKTIYSDDGFWQSSYGGPTSQHINPAFYPVAPELRYDSRVTIGALDASGDPFPENGLGDVGIDFSNFESGGALAADDGTWYILPTDGQGYSLGMETGSCQTVNGVLIARLTMFGLDSTVTLGALFQGRNALGITFQATAEATFSLGDFTDCNANGNNDACDIANGSSADANDNGIPDECESNCPWDLDGDGDTDVDDLLTVISNWNTLYDVDDLLAVLADFGCS